MKRLIMAAALLAAACQPLPAGGGIAPATQTSADAAAACAARGGEMRPQGRMQTLQCVIAYADAGKRCTDGDQCEGDCRADIAGGMPEAGAPVVGLCHADSGRFGCYATVEDGKAGVGICVD